jgi:hypothetical protein
MTKVRTLVLIVRLDEVAAALLKAKQHAQQAVNAGTGIPLYSFVCMSQHDRSRYNVDACCTTQVIPIHVLMLSHCFGQGPLDPAARLELQIKQRKQIWNSSGKTTS